MQIQRDVFEGPGRDRVRSYVERGETTAVAVEGLVVELNELFCRMEGHGSEAWFLIEGHSCETSRGCSCVGASGIEGGVSHTSDGGEV